MTAATLSSAGNTWLATADSPMAPITALRPSSRGTPAATSEPKAMVRMIRVIGRDSIPAFPRSDWIVSSMLSSR